MDALPSDIEIAELVNSLKAAGDYSNWSRTSFIMNSGRVLSFGVTIVCCRIEQPCGDFNACQDRRRYSGFSVLKT